MERSKQKQKSEEFRLRVSEEFKQEIARVAESMGVSKSDVARLALREYMDRAKEGSR